MHLTVRETEAQRAYSASLEYIKCAAGAPTTNSLRTPLSVFPSTRKFLMTSPFFSWRDRECVRGQGSLVPCFLNMSRTDE